MVVNGAPAVGFMPFGLGTARIGPAVGGEMDLRRVKSHFTKMHWAGFGGKGFLRLGGRGAVGFECNNALSDVTTRVCSYVVVTF